LGNPLKEISERIKLYLSITRARGIARRYFILNGFDGAMTIFGIIVASWFAKVQRPEMVVIAGLGACFAMGVSGFFGAYMAERAERDRMLRELEKEKNGNVDPIRYEASQFVSLYVALVDGLSPILTATISLTPFFLAVWSMLPIETAYISSFILTLGSLFSLGYYLGVKAKGNGWIYGLRMLAVGAVAAIFIFLIEMVF
jgi:predicted membrane protein (TIGR00267 family)